MKMNKKSWVWLLGGTLGILLLISGCWLFGVTMVLTYDIENEIASTNTHFNSFNIDLTQEEDWQDNKDKLDDIHHLFFDGKVENHLSTEATGQLYMYKDTTLHTIAEVESLATLVLDGVVIPADSTVRVILIDLDLVPVKDLVMEGKFGLYAIAKEVPFDIRVYDASVVVVFAVEP